MVRSLFRLIPAPVKVGLKASYRLRKRQIVRRFLAYGSAELEARLRSLGIGRGDTLMLHSGFDSSSGFRGSARELIDVFLGAVGTEGNLLMVSLPYRTSTLEYLQQGNVFDVNRTPSRMGMVSEVFRRRRGVRRSLHPTHPVLAYGAQAEWLVADHEKCVYGCGPGSPFEKLSLLDGQLVFFNVPLSTMTFFHYLEHLVESEIDFPLYVDQVFEVRTIDSSGTKTTVKTRAFAPEAIDRRRPTMLWAQLEKRSQVRRATVGNTRILAVDAKHAITCTQEMARAGVLFYD